MTSGNTDENCIFNFFFLIYLTFIESLKVVLIKVIAIFIMSAKLVTPELRGFQTYKDHDVIISIPKVINKI